jgi:deoxyribodipyrimidine photolyase-related protein
MGTFGVADLLTTKPYIAGSAYIHKMSDFCSSCRFDPKRTCPLTPMYWAYLARHREVLHGVPRMRLPLVAEARRSNEQRAADASVYESVSRALSQGDELAR